MIELKGIWVGEYSYDKKWMHEGSTPFRIVIETEDGLKFQGVVQNDVSFGGDPLPGKIVGKRIRDNWIEFIKEMPRHRALERTAGEIVEGGKSYQIMYLGELDSEGSYSGTWRIKGGLKWIDGRLMIMSSSSGQWSMVKMAAP